MIRILTLRRSLCTRTDALYVCSPQWHAFLILDFQDLIGGTSTGGIIAVLLGRMRLSVDDCLTLYSELAEEVFGKKRFGEGALQARFDAEKLKQVVIQTLERCGLNKDEFMFDDREDACKT
jgi:hypothetical protein